MEKKKNNIFRKIITFLCVVSVLLSIFVVSCSASDYAVGDVFKNTYKYGVPFDTYVYGLNRQASSASVETRFLYGVLRDWNSLDYTYDYGRVDRTFGGNKYSNLYWNQSDFADRPIAYTKFINSKLVSAVQLDNTVTHWADSPMNYTVYSTIEGLYGRDILFNYYTNTDSQIQNALSSYREKLYYEDALFSDNGISYGSAPTFVYNGIIKEGKINTNYFPSTLRLTYFASDDYNFDSFNNSVDNYSHPSTLIVKYSKVNVYSGEVDTVSYKHTYRLSNNFYTIDSHFNTLDYSYNEEIITAGAYSFRFGLTLYEINYDMDKIYSVISDICFDLENDTDDEYISSLHFTLFPSLVGEDQTILEEFNNESYNSYFNVYLNSNTGAYIPYSCPAIYSFALENTNINNTASRGTPSILEGNYADYLASQTVVYGKVDLEDFNLFDWLGSTIGSVFDVEIIGDITLAQVTYVVVGLGLTIMFLKIFAGG